jgi:hypothetical protein
MLNGLEEPLTNIPPVRAIRRFSGLPPPVGHRFISVYFMMFVTNLMLATLIERRNADDARQ